MYTGLMSSYWETLCYMLYAQTKINELLSLKVNIIQKNSLKDEGW